MAVLQRLQSVTPAELRFRTAVALRIRRDRLRTALAPPHWNRRRLARLIDGAAGPALRDARRALDRAAWDEAHRALLRHFTSRPGRGPVDPRSAAGVRDAVLARHPDAPAQAAARADRMLAGRYDILGYRDVPFGSPPAWHRDPVHGRTPPPVFWSRVPYLDPQCGDHKIIWEINRHQHWLGLARAWQLTSDRRYHDAFVSQLTDWMAANPPLLGVNWASMLELAFRSLSWLWALHFFAGAEPGGEGPWCVDLLLGLDRQLAHVEQNLSRYFSPNTHLSGEALGLYVAGAALPELRTSAGRLARGRQVLLEEIDRQVNADGGHAELSAHYHRYSTDFYLLAAMTARSTGDPAAARFEEAARRQAEYLRAITDDAGRLPLLGDDDGGLLFPICGRAASDCRDTLASAAAILDRPSLAAGAAPEETIWFCGRTVEPDRSFVPSSRALSDSGYYVSRTADGDHLIFDAGRHGYLNGGHAHADALSIVLTAAGCPLLVDAGTATYTMDPAARDRFRSTAMHNTVVVGGRPQSRMRGPFHWATRADARCAVWTSAPRFDYAEGFHDGYAPVRHRRAVLAIHGACWIVVDQLASPAGPPGAEAEVLWHLDPAWEAEPGAGGVGGGLALRHAGGLTAVMACSAGLEVLPHDAAGGLDIHAPIYGLVLRSRCLRSRIPLGGTVATVISRTARAASIEALPLAVPPGEGWMGAAFRVGLDEGQAVLLAAFERGSGAPEPGGPGRPWGAAGASTQGRLAWLPSDSAAPRILIPEPGGAGAGRA